VDEAGLPGFDISQWLGLWLPKGTPKNIIAKVDGAVVDGETVDKLDRTLRGGATFRNASSRAGR
jgi:tripartite-type tricarboxylate transporter receptor subunit TctC